MLRRLHRRLVRELYRLTGARPASRPYVTGDGFRALAGLIFEPGNERGRTNCFGDASVVFVHGHLLPQLWERELAKLTRPYVLISHNSDFDPTPLQGKAWPPNLVHWFAENCFPEDERVTPIPIGVENRGRANHGFAFRNATSIGTIPQDKLPRILYGFSLANNPDERRMALAALATSRVTSAIQGQPNPEQYLQRLKEHCLVASPAGNGTDCHRTWEALYVKTLPIVRRNPLTRAFFSLGLPLVLIDDWSDLLSWDQGEILRVCREMEGRWASPPLFMAYWEGQVRQAVDRC